MMNRTIGATGVGGGLIIVMTIVLSHAAQLLTSKLTYMTIRLAIEHGWIFATPS